MVDRTDGLKQTMPGVPREWVERLVTSDDDTDTLESSTAIFHKPTITPTEYEPLPGSGPTPTPLGTVMTLFYDNAADAAFRIFKVDPNFVGEASFHIHWTKGSAINESGNTVRWKLSYTVFDGSSEDIAQVTAEEILFDDTYDDSGTITRVVHRTPNVTASGLVAGYYVGAKIEYVPAETTLSGAPALVSADLIWRGSNIP